MKNRKGITSKTCDDSLVKQISIGDAYKMALRAKNGNDKKRANCILAIISRTMREDGRKGYYTEKIRFIGEEEHRLIGV